MHWREFTDDREEIIWLLLTTHHVDFTAVHVHAGLPVFDDHSWKIRLLGEGRFRADTSKV